jgi:hypothetical protein
MTMQSVQNFDTLQRSKEMLWMSQNTNHLPTHPVANQRLLKDVHDQSFNLYAPLHAIPARFRPAQIDIILRPVTQRDNHAKLANR